MTDKLTGRFDLAGNRVYDDPELQRLLGKSVSQVDAERRAASYTWHKNAGTLDVWYEQNDAGNNPYRKPSRGRGGR
jgi:hypothetical protein